MNEKKETPAAVEGSRANHETGIGGSVLNDNNSIHVSAVQYDRPVGKSISYENMEICVTRCKRPVEGVAVVKSFTNFKEYFNWRKQLTSDTMLVTGLFESAVDGFDVVYKDAIKHEQQVAASNDYLEFRAVPTVVHVDIDVKQPDEVAKLYPDFLPTFHSHEQAIDKLTSIAPWLKGIGIGVIDSSSANLFSPDGRELTGSGGLRLDFAIDDGTQVKAVLELLHELCWAQGYGWGFVDKGGRIQERSLVDLALTRPHQPDYAAPHVEGCESRRGFTLRDGAVLRVTDIPPLTEAQREAAQINRQVMLEALVPHADKTRAAVAKKTAQRITSKYADTKPRDANRMAARLLEGVLTGDLTVVFEDGAQVTADELVIKGAVYDGKVCLDPLEPDYDGGRYVGKFYFNDGARPIILSYAHGQQLYNLRLSFNTYKAMLESDDIDHDLVMLGLALIDCSKTEHEAAVIGATRSLGLGNRTSVVKDDVAQIRRDNGIARVSASQRPAASARVYELDEPLSEPQWPVTVGEDDNLHAVEHVDNYGYMLEQYGLTLRYNQITKEVDWGHRDGGIDVTTDNAAENMLGVVTSLCALNGLPTRALGTFLTSIAERNQHNPVLEYLKQLPEVPGSVYEAALDRLVEKCRTSNDEAARISWDLFFMGAVAAADNGQMGCELIPAAHPSFEYVLCLLSGQGAGKSKGLRKLLPAELRQHFGDSKVLDVKSRDSQKEVLSYWVVELGEIDATFGKSNVAHMKGFISRERDQMRLPYAKSWSNFGRRTVFVGTVNEPAFLRDKTGNRRYLPLAIDTMPVMGDDELELLWAGAWTQYVSGMQWWPAADEDKVLADAVEAFEEQTATYELLSSAFRWDAVNTPGIRLDRLTATSIYQGHVDDMGYRSVPKPQELSTVGDAMRKLWKGAGAVFVNGELKWQKPNGELVRCNSTDGKNRGWLVPMKPWDSK